MTDAICSVIFLIIFCWYICAVIHERERNAEMMAKLEILIKILDKKIKKERENKE